MWQEFITSTDIWSIVIKSLLSLAITGLCGLVGTLIGKAISNHKTSKIYRYARTVVEAAEQKFPNEGRKMGPEKMQYVMDQLIIKFPSIGDNQYLYNIAEQAVYKLNQEKIREDKIKEFKDKYGEDPIGIETTTTTTTVEEKVVEDNVEEVIEKPVTTTTTTTTQKKKKLSSF